MKKTAVKKYEEGYNCSQSILIAAAEKYKFDVSQEMLKSLAGIMSGLGVGGLCSAVFAAVMVLGLLFDEGEVKRLRLKLITEVQERFGAIDCCRLVSKNEGNCERLIGDICDILEEVINGE